MSPPQVCPRPGAGLVGPDCALFAARLRRAVLTEKPRPSLGALVWADFNRQRKRAEAARPEPSAPAPSPTRPALPPPSELPTILDHLARKGAKP